MKTNRKLTDAELKDIPSHFCRDCNTIFGLEHDDVFDEDEEACCPYDNEHEDLVLVRDHEDHVFCLMVYAAQLETKLEKRGSYSHWAPAGTDSEC